MSSPDREQLNIRLTPALRKRLDEYAAERKTTISGAVKAAVLEATKSDRGVPSEAEVLELLGEAARTGNVSAMKELRNYHRERNSDETEEAPLAAVDELAIRRSA